MDCSAALLAAYALTCGIPSVLATDVMKTAPLPADIRGPSL